MIRIIKRLFFVNYPLKIMSFILALLAWYFIMGEEVVELHRRLEVRILVPKGYVLSQGDKRFKYITLRGPRVYLRDFIDQTELQAMIRINNTEQNQLRYRLNRSDLVGDLDHRVSIEIMDPVLDLEIGQEHTRSVPIKEVIRGVPAPGFNINKISIAPSHVSISGMKSVVNSVEFVFTEAIDVNNLDQSKIFDVDLLKDELNYYTTTTTSAKVSMQIAEGQINKVFRGISLELVGAIGRYKSNVESVDIELQGSAGVLEFIKQEDLRAFIDISDLSVGKHEKKIQVRIPNYTTLIDTRPSNTMIEIFKVNQPENSDSAK